MDRLLKRAHEFVGPTAVSLPAQGQQTQMPSTLLKLPSREAKHTLTPATMLISALIKGSKSKVSFLCPIKRRQLRTA